MYLVGSTDDSS